MTKALILFASLLVGVNGAAGQSEIVECLDCFETRPVMEPKSSRELWFQFEHNARVEADSFLTLDQVSEFDGLEASPFWFSLQNGILTQSNGYVHILETFMINDILTCASAFMRDTSQSLVKTVVLGCNESVWDGTQWYASPVAFEDVELPQDVKVFDDQYIDFE